MNIDEKTAYILSLIERLNREQKDQLIDFINELLGGK
jgi:hypothetical protein